MTENCRRNDAVCCTGWNKHDELPRIAGAMVPAITKNLDEWQARSASPRRQGGATSAWVAVYRWLCAGHEPGSKAMPNSAILSAATLLSLFGLLFMWLCYAGGVKKSATSKWKPVDSAQSPIIAAVPAIAGNRPLFILYRQPL